VSGIETPCVKVCVIEPESGLCIGCLRRRDEIAAWSGLSPEARRAIVAELPARAPRLSRRKGGRAGRLGR
jgi:predicted Fe-S protein YdhL (DUF1289 family)